MLLRLTAIVMIIYLTGCVTTNEYRENHYEEPDKSRSDISFIEGTSNGKALLDIQYYKIAAIDGKPILPPAYRDLFQDGIRVNKGEHEFIFVGETNGKSLFDSCPCRAFWKTKFKIEKGKHYLLQGEVDGKNMKFWITDKKTGKSQTEIYESEFKSFKSGQTYIYIPPS